MKKFLLFFGMISCMLSASAITVDDICGDYMSTYYYRYKTYGSVYYGPYSQTGLAITKTDDTHVTIKGLAGGYIVCNAIFDASAMTLTLDDTEVHSSYYTVHAVVSAGDGEEITEELKPCVATINEDGTIQVDYDEISNGYWYYGYKETLTKVNMSKEWEEKGTLNYLLDDENQTVYRSVSATLTKWNGADFEYELTYGDPSYGNANPSTIQFNVNDDLQIELVNGWYSSATTPTAWYYYPFSDCNTIKLYTGAYSGFDEEEKNLYMWYYWYDSASSTSNERQGFMDFNWGEETGINTISGKAQNTVRKYIQNGSLVIVKDSHKYNALGTEIK